MTLQKNPHHTNFLYTQNIHLDATQLSVSVIIIAVLGCVGVGPDLELSLHHPSHAVVLHCHPVHKRTEDLVLDLLDATVGVEMLAQRHNGRGDDLINVIINDPELSKVLHL